MADASRAALLLAAMATGCGGGAGSRATPASDPGAISDASAPTEAASDASATPDGATPDAPAEAWPLHDVLQTFMSLGGNPATPSPGGDCWFAAGNVGETPTLEPCAPQTPLVTLGVGAKDAGEIRFGALCLQAPAGGAAGNTLLAACDGSPAQSWGFEAGRIESNPRAGATNCLTDSGGDNPDNLSVGLGNCAPDASGRNLWMPVGFPMVLETGDASHAWCACNLQLGHDSDQPGTALVPTPPSGAPPTWLYGVQFHGGHGMTSWTNPADGFALDVFGGQLDGGAGVVDMATPTGAPQQILGLRHPRGHAREDRAAREQPARRRLVPRRAGTNGRRRRPYRRATVRRPRRRALVPADRRLPGVRETATPPDRQAEILDEDLSWRLWRPGGSLLTAASPDAARPTATAAIRVSPRRRLRRARRALHARRRDGDGDRHRLPPLGRHARVAEQLVLVPLDEARVVAAGDELGVREELLVEREVRADAGHDVLARARGACARTARSRVGAHTLSFEMSGS